MQAYRCPWQTGDVYALSITKIDSEQTAAPGDYFLLQKIDEMVWYPEHTPRI